MKKQALRILVVFGILTADPASAWFWAKNEVKAAAPASEVKKDKGFWAGVVETGRDIGHYFKRVGREVKKDSKGVPGELKEEGKLVGKSIKKSTKTLGRDAKKGGKAVGQGFKNLGHDFKDAAKSVRDGNPEDRDK
jgi:hypothetical protein